MQSDVITEPKDSFLDSALFLSRKPTMLHELRLGCRLVSHSLPFSVCTASEAESNVESINSRPSASGFLADRCGAVSICRRSLTRNFDEINCIDSGDLKTNGFGTHVRGRQRLSRALPPFSSNQRDARAGSFPHIGELRRTGGPTEGQAEDCMAPNQRSNVPLPRLRG